MNIAKHMEAVFVVALVAFIAAGSVSTFTDAVPPAHASPAVILDSSIATETKMAVVVVKAKRLAPEQQPIVLADRRAGGSRI